MRLVLFTSFPADSASYSEAHAVLLRNAIRGRRKNASFKNFSRFVAPVTKGVDVVGNGRTKGRPGQAYSQKKGNFACELAA